ncbi:MAG: PIN domain-containing protein [Syntrophobacteraceae bacterium]
MIAFLNDEEGADKVEQLFEGAVRSPNRLIMHEVNLLEIYYGVFRYGGESLADQTLDKISGLPLKVISGLQKIVFREAGRLKATYKISLADSIALAEAKYRGVPLVTCDHHEFDIIEKSNELKFCWIR